MDEKEFDNQSIQDNNEETENLEPITNISDEKKSDYHVNGALYSFFYVFGIVFLFSLFIFQILLTPITVVGRSMQPTINTSVVSDTDDEHCDYVYYQKSNRYENDDIVIVENANKTYVARYDVEFFIKRVIACPTQTITFFLTNSTTSGFVTTFFYDIIVKDKNGNIINLEDKYLTEEMSFTSTDITFTSSTWFKTIFSNLANELLPDEERKFELILGKNEYFVMGDNRDESEDSRYFGPVKYNDISGDVKIHIPYGKTIFYGIWQYLKSIF